ncbi:hypothetical protein KQX54_004262 [Cotesia glomerata]|uniref:Platelet-derived growth factor receptor-like protein n=1 Tax=Cotesia glomerata TaxID=32391 RepID=A0AAV7IUL4_COTGL|nr:hypothetical protein KQX54_004262 [Cotesia glomerata]
MLVCLSELTIAPTGQIVINEGDSLEITCTASEDVDFFYPKFIPYLVDTSPSSITNETANGGSKFIFKRPKAVFGDTGYYGCVEASKNKRKLNLRDVYVTPETYDEIDIKWIYVYVKSDNHPLTFSGYVEFIEGSTGNDLVIPCRPTSPKYNVTLSDSVVDTATIFPMSKKLSYDPKIGFTINDFEKPDKRYFFCKVQEHHKEFGIVKATVSRPSQKLALGIYTDTLQQLTLGENFSMNCSIPSSGTFTDDVLYWKTPRKTQPIVKLMKELNSKGEDIYISELTIKNVTNDDVGEYKCSFYGSGPIQIVKANLQLHAENYLNVSTEDTEALNGTMIENGQPLDAWISVSAYPLPTFKWIDPKGNEILNNWTPQYYDVNSEKFFIKLKTRSLTLEDEGNYTLIVTNFASNDTFTFFIGISVKLQIFETDIIPIVEVSKGDEVKAECKVIGKPLPLISWKYSNHFTNLTENSPNNSSFKISSINNGVNKTKSTFELKAERTGKLICTACNEVDCVYSIVKIINVPVSMELKPEAPTTFRSISLDVGDPLTIDCKSSKKITFFYPEFDRNVVTSQENISTLVTDNGHTGRFERQQTTYSDSGWYGCSNLPEKYQIPIESYLPFTPDIYTDSDVQWIYVFVASTFRLFVDSPYFYQDNNGKYYVNGEVGKDVLLPCRPSSPDFNVKLYSAGKVIDAEFDPKKGMLMKNLKADSPLDYVCVIMLNDRLKKAIDFRIVIFDQPNFFEKPIITTKSPTHMEIGKTFKMDCSVSLSYNNNLFLTWVTPQTTNHMSRKFNVIPSYSHDVNSEIRYASYQLTIENVTAEDFGDYECRYFKYASIETAKVTLTPHERKHLELSISVPNGKFSVGGKEESILQVDVDAYPMPELHWYNPERKELPIPSKFKNFEVNGEKFTVDLSAHKFTLDDMGILTFTANNSAGTKNITFDVVVNSPPKTEGLKKQSSYSLNEEAKFHCRARGNPVPNIAWKYWDEHLNLVPIEFNQITEAGPKIGEVSSTVNVTINKGGFILCTANNVHGKDILREKIIIKKPTTSFKNSDFNETIEKDAGFLQIGIRDSDSGSKNPDIKNNASDIDLTNSSIKKNDFNLYKLGTVNQEIITTKGASVTMHCSALTDEFPDIEWFNNSNMLITDERIMISYTNVSQSHSSQLTISDVAKWDEGDYSCEGTMDDGLIIGNFYHLQVNGSVCCVLSVGNYAVVDNIASIFYVDTSPSSITNETAHGGSKFIFKRPKAVFGDTGYYGCVEASKKKLNLRDVYVTPENYDEIDIKWTYVYVKCN